ncbi:FAD-dependent oxidoreductase [Candidatus Arsenophonus nilaparvatae]|uniref:FAD-dependent oxidoreductase n=1 Tax=Candidatus Arsenophonus nilaparvatae TaxID=1247023 RepID=UPI000509A067|nr:FAD-dependent oxidoreductase [Candidatus Arsenophonus nilaparvatae]
MNKLIIADPSECIGCHVCEIACVVAHNHQRWPQSTREFVPRIRVLNDAKNSIAVTCRHCNNAPCITSCPVDALRFVSATVQLDQTRCIGCKSCIVACPFGAIDMVPAVDSDIALAQKCDMCQTINADQPACVTHCPTQALRIVDEQSLLTLRQERQQRTVNRNFRQLEKQPRRKQILNKPLRKGAQKVSAQQRIQHFAEIYIALNQQQASYESSRCLYCAQKASCNLTCPLHNHIPDFIQLASEGNIIAAAELCHQSSSLPEICGRVCPQERLCEGACTMKQHGGSVAIGNLERYITDTALAQGWQPNLSQVSQRSERVAIIGSGPAGLGCADILARAGVKADVYERHPEIGGLLTFGIPPFKLDKQLLSSRREIFSTMGIQFHLNCEIGQDIAFSTLANNYDAIFLGIGTYGLMNIGLENEHASGVIQALDFLTASTRRVMGLKDDPRYPWCDVTGKNIVVLGGGDTAMDCLRTAVRLSAASVTCAYRRDEASMPGSKKEVINAREEGVEFLFNVSPQQIILDDTGQVSAVRLTRVQLGEPGNDGRRRPQLIAGSEFELAVDVLIIAFGFQPHDMPWLRGHNIKLDDWGLLQTGGQGRLLTQTSNDKVFAGGDAVHGADLVVTAMAAGRQAAWDILNLFDRKTSNGQ